MLIATSDDLDRLLNSPRFSPELVVRLGEKGWDSLDPRLDGPFVAVDMEAFESEVHRHGRLTEFGRVLGRLARRRGVVLHHVGSRADVELALRRESRIRDWILEVAESDRLTGEPWYQVWVHSAPLEQDWLRAIDGFVRESCDGRSKIARVATAYILDRQLRGSAEGHVLESPFVWPDLLCGLLNRIHSAPQSSAQSDSKDEMRLAAWRTLSVGPQYPQAEFRSAFRELIGRLRTPSSEVDVAFNPDKVDHVDRWQGQDPGPVEAALKAASESQSSDSAARSTEVRVDFRPRSFNNWERQVARWLPDSEDERTTRALAGRQWRLRDLEAFRSHVRQQASFEQAAWEAAHEDPAALQRLQVMPIRTNEFRAALHEHVERWRRHRQKIGDAAEGRRRVVVGAGVLDELEEHFVNWPGRLLFAVFTSLLMLYLSYAVVAPLIPGGMPWWVWGMGLGGACGAFLSAVLSHELERQSARHHAHWLNNRLSHLAGLDLSRASLELLRNAQKVGDLQLAMLGRRVVRELSRRAGYTVGLDAQDQRITRLVAARVQSDGAELPVVEAETRRQEAILENTLWIRTHGTESPELRIRNLKRASQVELESQRVALRKSWKALLEKLDPNVRGHFPVSGLQKGWFDLLDTRRRDFYARLIRFTIDSEAGHETDGNELDLEISSRFMGEAGRDTRPLLSCRWLTRDTVATNDSSKNLSLSRVLRIGTSEQLKWCPVFKDSFAKSQFRSLKDLNSRIDGVVTILEEVQIRLDGGGEGDVP